MVKDRTLKYVTLQHSNTIQKLSDRKRKFFMLPFLLSLTVKEGRDYISVACKLSSSKAAGAHRVSTNTAAVAFPQYMDVLFLAQDIIINAVHLSIKP